MKTFELMKDRKICAGDVYFAKKTQAIMLIDRVMDAGETNVLMLAQGKAVSLAGQSWTNNTKFPSSGGHLFLYNLYEVIEETRQGIIDDVS